MLRENIFFRDTLLKMGFQTYIFCYNCVVTVASLTKILATPLCTSVPLLISTSYYVGLGSLVPIEQLDPQLFTQ